MKPLRLAVIGFGKLGKACANLIVQSKDLTLTGIVRRPLKIGEPLPEPLRKIRTGSHISELGEIDRALICLPTEFVMEAVHDLLQHKIPIVECASLHGKAFLKHKAEIQRIASHHKVAAIVGAGWDPGALSLLRSLFALLTPKGQTQIAHHPGVSLHHTIFARDLPGVKDALSTELKTKDGKTQRYVYVELKKGADFESIQQTIVSDPLFLNEETFVFQVDDIAALEQEEYGVVMERKGLSGLGEHQLLLLEGRFNQASLAAQVMVAAARALTSCKAGAFSLIDLPPGAFWGDRQRRLELEEDWT